MLGTVSAILGKEDLIISDELNHASIIDGCRLSRAAIKIYKHRDLADCERICKETEIFSGTQAADHRRRVFHGWRHRAA